MDKARKVIFLEHLPFGVFLGELKNANNKKVKLLAKVLLNAYCYFFSSKFTFFNWKKKIPAANNNKILVGGSGT